MNAPLRPPWPAAAAADAPLAERLAAVRALSVALAAPLTAEDCTAQAMPDASPVKWHLAHTTWFFETFVLEPHTPAFVPFDPAFRVLFNSYYVGVGERHPRPQRGLLTRPGLDHVLAYRRAVDAQVQALLAAGPPAAVQDLVELGLQHEQQHQELIVTDLKALFSLNPLQPALLPARAADAAALPPPLQWIEHAGGAVEVGHTGTGFAFDNEGPRHRVLLAPHALASRPVSNAEWMAFIEARGYASPQWWLAEGWDVRVAQGWEAPGYWQRVHDGWSRYTLAGPAPVHPAAPVSHISYYEADAFARWAGARLPTEFEWEAAAGAVPAAGNFLDDGRLDPAPATPAQWYGGVWQWTASSYAAYPGFRVAAGAVGEYNGKFMVNQYVLRGGSCATPRAHLRPSYRNFFPAAARWQFSGVRLARDA